MTNISRTERATEVLHGFLRSLREAGLPATATKQIDFLRALVLCPPTRFEDLYWTARVTLTLRVEDIPTFDAVFDAWFRDAGAVPISRERATEPHEEVLAASPAPDDGPSTAAERWGKSGIDASPVALEHGRTFPATDEDKREQLHELRRTLISVLPAIGTRRLRQAVQGRRLDIRRVLRAAIRTGGEVVEFAWRERPRRPRRVLLLVDVSRSLRQYSPDLLRFAHAAVGVSKGVEVFTFGTRLTRVTRELAVRDVDDALTALSAAALDADGGTRIGPALQEFLANDRFVTHARGALVVVMSDGLERGDPQAMADAIGRLSRLGHRLLWWSPLACDPAYVPSTRGMQAVLEYLDRLAGAEDIETLAEEARQIPLVCSRSRRSAQTTDSARSAF